MLRGPNDPTVARAEANTDDAQKKFEVLLGMLQSSQRQGEWRWSRYALTLVLGQDVPLDHPAVREGLRQLKAQDAVIYNEELNSLTVTHKIEGATVDWSKESELAADAAKTAPGPKDAPAHPGLGAGLLGALGLKSQEPSPATAKPRWRLW